MNPEAEEVTLKSNSNVVIGTFANKSNGIPFFLVFDDDVNDVFDDVGNNGVVVGDNVSVDYFFAKFSCGLTRCFASDET